MFSIKNYADNLINNVALIKFAQRETNNLLESKEVNFELDFHFDLGSIVDMVDIRWMTKNDKKTT